ncbi:hypothetical protein [Yaniella halotolerans]|uniref:hypothetical protein n=1 Tax=Yaniella halotolerans TaxID=225453 RepID=UPI0003B7442E|nr:hypothetical protein [Yaniella halotolerans]
MQQSDPNRFRGITSIGVGASLTVILLTLALEMSLLWTMVLMLPVIAVAITVQRLRPSFPGKSASSTALVITLTVFTLIVPWFTWEGSAVFGLAALCLVYGALTAYLAYKAWPAPPRKSLAVRDWAPADETG